jgi:hypothetical protein
MVLAEGKRRGNGIRNIKHKRRKRRKRRGIKKQKADEGGGK